MLWCQYGVCERRWRHRTICNGWHIARYHEILLHLLLMLPPQYLIKYSGHATAILTATYTLSTHIHSTPHTYDNGVHNDSHPAAFGGTALYIHRKQTRLERLYYICIVPSFEPYSDQRT